MFLAETTVRRLCQVSRLQYGVTVAAGESKVLAFFSFSLMSCDCSLTTLCEVQPVHGNNVDYTLNTEPEYVPVFVNC